MIEKDKKVFWSPLKAKKKDYEIVKFEFEMSNLFYK